MCESFVILSESSVCVADMCAHPLVTELVPKEKGSIVVLI